MSNEINETPAQEYHGQHVYVKKPACHDLNQQDMAIAAEAVTRLGSWYPGHIWRVVVNSDRLGGVALVYHQDLSHIDRIPTPIVVHLKNVYGDPNYTWAMKAGGELLERAFLSREQYAEDQEVTKFDGVDGVKPVKGLII